MELTLVIAAIGAILFWGRIASKPVTFHTDGKGILSTKKCKIADGFILIKEGNAEKRIKILAQPAIQRKYAWQRVCFKTCEMVDHTLPWGTESTDYNLMPELLNDIMKNEAVKNALRSGKDLLKAQTRYFLMGAGCGAGVVALICLMFVVPTINGSTNHALDLMYSDAHPANNSAITGMIIYDQNGNPVSSGNVTMVNGIPHYT